jgi:hypothetical protein
MTPVSRLEEIVKPDGRRETFAYYPTGDPSEGKLMTITLWGVLDADIEDHDRLLLIVPSEKGRLEYALDIPLIARCGDAELPAVWRSWRLSVEQLAPGATCNGIPCAELWSPLKECRGDDDRTPDPNARISDSSSKESF